ncbi:helix-turn-helix domain-containing protein [Spirosoma oryzicola]|nr:helix-turn-helix domain-containing protein [Spirosoma oryzicola]
MVPDSVLQSDLLTPSEKLLFPQLVVLCGAEGMTKADNDELAAHLGISERSVSGFITNLNRAGFITVDVDRKLKTKQRTIRLNELTQDFALSPILLQKLMLADADSCVKLAQILASALPDAKSCVMLAQNLASAIKDECADSESFTNIDTKSCVNSGQNSGFSEERDNIYNNILLTTPKVNTNTTSKLSAQKPENDEQTQKPASTPLIWLGSEPVAPAELGKLVNIRGVEDQRLEPFVTENSGRHYNDLKELADLVRKWLRRTRPKPPKKSIEERREDFTAKLHEYDRINPKMYPKDFYNNFFTYWTTVNDSNTTMRYEKDPYFFSSLGNKLAYSYKNVYIKNQTYANADKPTGNSRTVPVLTADDLSDGHDSAPHSFDESDDETGTNEYTTLHLTLE